MENLPLQRAIGLAIAALAWTACGGSSSVAPPAAALRVPAIATGDARIYNVSGQYAGTVKDSVYGSGKAIGGLAQYRNAAGGVLTTTYASKTITLSRVFSLSGTSLTGTASGTAGKLSCVFDESATYEPSTHRLTGSYRSFHNCGGVTEKGTFDLKQRCFYARNWARNDAGGVKQC